VRIQYHYIHIEKSAALEEHARKSFESLEHLVSGLDPEGSAVLKLEFVRTTAHHHKGMVYEVKAQFSIPKKDFFAEAHDEDMHAALNHVKHKLAHLVQHYKEEAKGHHGA